MAEALERLTADTPLVLVLEDLHWADYSTLDLVSALARRREPARLLVVATYRPVEAVLSGHPLRTVKQDLQARGLCHELLPEADDLDPWGYPIVGAQLPDEQVRAAREAVRACPLSALRLVGS